MLLVNKVDFTKSKRVSFGDNGQFMTNPVNTPFSYQGFDQDMADVYMMQSQMRQITQTAPSSLHPILNAFVTLFTTFFTFMAGSFSGEKLIEMTQTMISKIKEKLENDIQDGDSNKKPNKEEKPQISLTQKLKNWLKSFSFISENENRAKLVDNVLNFTRKSIHIAKGVFPYALGLTASGTYLMSLKAQKSTVTKNNNQTIQKPMTEIKKINNNDDKKDVIDNLNNKEYIETNSMTPSTINVEVNNKKTQVPETAEPVLEMDNSSIPLNKIEKLRNKLNTVE